MSFQLSCFAYTKYSGLPANPLRKTTDHAHPCLLPKLSHTIGSNKQVPDLPALSQFFVSLLTNYFDLTFTLRSLPRLGAISLQVACSGTTCGQHGSESTNIRIVCQTHSYQYVQKKEVGSGLFTSACLQKGMFLFNPISNASPSPRHIGPSSEWLPNRISIDIEPLDLGGGVNVKSGSWGLFLGMQGVSILKDHHDIQGEGAKHFCSLVFYLL